MVCTGNVCRSPLAERAGRARLARALGEGWGVGGGGPIRLESAGTRAVVGAPMDAASARALARLGGDPAGFRARQLTAAMANGADLILTMTRDHRREVLGYAPRALSRTFTLREAAALLATTTPEELEAGDGPRDRLRAVVSAIARARAHRAGSADDDVPDPVGRPDELHAAVGRIVVDALVPVLERLTVALLATAPATGHAR